MATFDVLIVDGSYAGMAAALQLADAAGRYWYWTPVSGATTAHGILGQDGRPSSAIADDARN